MSKWWVVSQVGRQVTYDRLVWRQTGGYASRKTAKKGGRLKVRHPG